MKTLIAVAVLAVALQLSLTISKRLLEENSEDYSSSLISPGTD